MVSAGLGPIVSISPESHPPFPRTKPRQAMAACRYVSISPESHPPFPLPLELAYPALPGMFQSRLSPIRPFHSRLKMGRTEVEMFQSRLSPIRPFHQMILIGSQWYADVSISPESHPPFPPFICKYSSASISAFQSRLSPIRPFHVIQEKGLLDQDWGFNLA